MWLNIEQECMEVENEIAEVEYEYMMVENEDHCDTQNHS